MASINRERVAADWASEASVAISGSSRLDGAGRTSRIRPMSWSSYWRARWSSRSLGRFVTLRLVKSF